MKAIKKIVAATQNSFDYLIKKYFPKKNKTTLLLKMYKIIIIIITLK